MYMLGMFVSYKHLVLRREMQDRSDITHHKGSLGSIKNAGEREKAVAG